MAKELVELLSMEQKLSDSDIVFFDNRRPEVLHLYNRFQVLKSFDAVSEYFKNYGNKFTLGVGNPEVRKALCEKFEHFGGVLTTVVSEKAHIGHFGTELGPGCLLMQGVQVTNDVSIGKGVLVNLNTTISHDSRIGDFCELACNVTIPGGCEIGDSVFIGSSVTLNPKIKIGDNAIIGSGAVIIKDVPSGATVVGNPGKVIKQNG